MSKSPTSDTRGDCVAPPPVTCFPNNLNCLDDTNTYAAAGVLHNDAGVDTYVIGMGETVNNKWDTQLQEIAKAGGTGAVIDQRTDMIVTWFFGLDVSVRGGADEAEPGLLGTLDDVGPETECRRGPIEDLDCRAGGVARFILLTFCPQGRHVHRPVFGNVGDHLLFYVLDDRPGKDQLRRDLH